MVPATGLPADPIAVGVTVAAVAACAILLALRRRPKR
jgi:hypothetical protein